MKFAIVSLINTSYVEPFKIMVTSFVKNNPLFNGDYVVMHDPNMNSSDLDGVIASFSFLKDRVKFYQIQYEFSSYNTSLNSSGNRFKDWTRTDYSAFSRFEMFNLEEYDKLIYLDVDIVVHKTIDFFINGCNESECYAVRPDGSGGAQTFNAGIMVINKKTSFGEYKNRCIKILNSTNRLSGNQPVFIECFKNKVSFLPIQYNLTVRDKAAKTLLDTDHAIILHFPGKEKPWHDKKKFSDYYVGADGYVRQKFLQIWKYYSDLYKNPPTPLNIQQ